MNLTSVDFASIIRMYAYGKFHVVLGKTQVLKLLYILYGMYYAKTNNKLFSDDTLRAWPYGPVFPKVYRTFDDNATLKVAQDKINDLLSDPDAAKLLIDVVTNRHQWTAYQLTKWSHEVNSPWYKTVYGENGDKKSTWGGEIKDEYIGNFFSNFSL